MQGDALLRLKELRKSARAEAESGSSSDEIVYIKVIRRHQFPFYELPVYHFHNFFFIGSLAF